MSLDSALANLEQALRKTPQGPLPLGPDDHPVFPPIPTGPDSFQELVRKKALENQASNAVLCRHCQRPRLEHLTTIPTSVSASIALICPTPTLFEAFEPGP
jgi:hypothetical protein